MPSAAAGAYHQAMTTEDDEISERIRGLKLILNVAHRFDEFVGIFRRSAGRAEATTEIARTFNCTEWEATALLLPLTVHRLVLPESLQRLEEELAEYERMASDSS